MRVSLRAGPGEEAVAEWTALSTVAFADQVARAAGACAARPVLIGVDGRSGGGKTTTALVLSDHLPEAQVLQTDDIAWYESMFGWDELLAAHVLRPLREGTHVNYRPPAWDRRRRPGAMSASATSRYIVIEGCGAIRRSLAPLLDVRVWVQSDYDEAERRGILRDGGTDTAAAFWREWEAQEVPFFAQNRPWERADLFACGTPPPDVPPGHVLASAAGLATE